MIIGSIPFDYPILDLNYLEKVAKFGTLKFLVDFINILDFSNDKFDLLNKIHNSGSQKVIVKLSRVSRNVGKFPVLEQNIERLLLQLEDGLATKSRKFF